MLSWEYPPRVVGGIARHVKDLSEALVRAGHMVTVLTADASGQPEFEDTEGVRVWRNYAGTPPARDFLVWVLQLNVAMLERAMQLEGKDGPFDIIHAHDWLGAYAGKALKHAWKAPLVATIHATEWGRNNGLHNDLQRYISDVEWWLAYEAWQVICCSKYMRAELQSVFQVPDDKLSVIPNGVYPHLFRTGPHPDEVRWRFAAPNEKVVFHVGRLVREKGLDVLIDAVPLVLRERSDVKFIVAGKGPHETSLKEHARAIGVHERMYFTGYVDDDLRNALYRMANVAVFPSLYEPFGIVALEAMAAGTPVVVSDTGGISEVVEETVTGLKCRTGDPQSLAEQILWALGNPLEARAMSERAARVVESQYNWDSIAATTAQVYGLVRDELEASGWTPGLSAAVGQGLITEHLKYGEAGPYWETGSAETGSRYNR